MATTYSAPGVYVEEVPSAQQPIAGVGTNTVGLIGIWPEGKITYPVPNERYDPQRAMAELQTLEEKNKPAIDKALKELDTAKANEARLQADLEGLPPGEEKKSDRKEKTTALEEARKETGKKEEALTAARKLPSNPELMPYHLTGQKIKVWETDKLGNKKEVEKELKDFELDSSLPGDAKLCTNFTEYTDRFGPF